MKFYIKNCDKIYEKYVISTKIFEVVVRLLLLYYGQFISLCLYGTKKLLPSHKSLTLFFFMLLRAADYAAV